MDDARADGAAVPHVVRETHEEHERYVDDDGREVARDVKTTRVVARTVQMDGGGDGVPEEPAGAAEVDEETYLRYLTSAEVAELSEEAFARLYPGYQRNDSKEGRMGFNLIDPKEGARWRWVPTREERDATGTCGGVRRGFRLSEKGQAVRFKYLVDALCKGACSTAWFLNISLAPKTRRMQLLGSVLRANAKLAASALTAGPGAACQVRFLNLKGCRIGAEGAAKLAAALMENTSIARLNLCGNDLGEEGVVPIAGVLASSRTLQALDLSLNAIGDAGCAAVCDAILSNIHSPIASLDLSTNAIGSRGGWHLATLIREHANLIILMLVRNRLGSTPVALARSGAASIFAEYPKAGHLHHLNMAYNSITEKDFDFLIEAQHDVEWEARVYPTEPDPNADPRPAATRHLVLTGNMASVKQMAAIGKSFEVTKYTAASRAGKAPVFRPKGAYYDYTEENKKAHTGLTSLFSFTQSEHVEMQSGGETFTTTAKYNFRFATSETTETPPPHDPLMLPPPVLGGDEEEAAPL